MWCRERSESMYSVQCITVYSSTQYIVNLSCTSMVLTTEHNMQQNRVRLSRHSQASSALTFKFETVKLASFKLRMPYLPERQSYQFNI